MLQCGAKRHETIRGSSTPLFRRASATSTHHHHRLTASYTDGQFPRHAHHRQGDRDRRRCRREPLVRPLGDAGLARTDGGRPRADASPPGAGEPLFIALSSHSSHRHHFTASSVATPTTSRLPSHPPSPPFAHSYKKYLYSAYTTATAGTRSRITSQSTSRAAFSRRPSSLRR